MFRSSFGFSVTLRDTMILFHDFLLTSMLYKKEREKLNSQQYLLHVFGSSFVKVEY